MKNTPNIAFFGTPQLAVYVLEELEQEGIVPSIVVTPPDKPAGRALTLTAPAVKVWAGEREIPVLQPTSFKDKSDLPELLNTEWSMFIVAAYNTILPQWILDLPRNQVLNVHPSLLPKLRGPSPVRSAILRDERTSVGVSIITLDAEVDHGAIVAQATVELPEWPILGHELDELLFREGGRLLAEVIPLWLAGTITPDIQNHAMATYTDKFVKTDGLVDLSGDAYDNYLKYCAMDGWPGVYTFVPYTDASGAQVVTRLKITDADYTDGIFNPLKVVPEGKKEVLWSDWKRTHLS